MVLNKIDPQEKEKKESIFNHYDGIKHDVENWWNLFQLIKWIFQSIGWVIKGIWKVITSPFD
jgi:hypothetical protein